MGCSIGRVAARFGLSRSTLLYYDSIGLLVPSGRTAANYREYSEADLERMEQIAIYREVGVPLEAIREMLDGRTGASASVLHDRLVEINDEIRRLRDQQQVLVKLLRNRKALRRTRVMTKQSWVALLAASGMGEEDMQRWHVEFESLAPEAHQDFLESLGIPKAEIREIRKRSRAGKL